MPTSNPRVNVTFEPNLNDQVALLAKQEHKSVSKLVKDLVIEALEKREDMYLSTLAEQRDVNDKQTISHQDAWK